MSQTRRVLLLLCCISTCTQNASSAQFRLKLSPSVGIPFPNKEQQSKAVFYSFLLCALGGSLWKGAQVLEKRAPECSKTKHILHYVAQNIGRTTFFLGCISWAATLYLFINSQQVFGIKTREFNEGGGIYGTFTEPLVVRFWPTWYTLEIPEKHNVF